ncbi:Oxidoreductase, 2OG-Fe oxygenase family [Pseudomonas savastanoi pv. glycinea]|uniref:2OG-Fe oxygenase family oxidoreductase n=3 Tax=Pseudomonas savastanoi pv. glycinea TaxID=318 RepID=A0A3M3HWU4_PSESG|nr:Oxidoreductase, 2OG-Fe oxygenase family [Pseudomonas savastanoi pv. glycinea]RMO32879.1 2OG-Fe oxygenase family oxidoreductase [Pseudomonas savastanoi pv. glycinea]
MPNRQSGANRSQCGLIIGFAFRRLGEGREFFKLRVRQVAIDVQQRVVQISTHLRHQALALAFEHALCLASTEQAGNHLAQAVCGNACDGKADFRAGLSGRQCLGQMADQQLTRCIRFDMRQPLGMFGQLIGAGGGQLGVDDLAAQRRLEKLQRRGRVLEAFTQAPGRALVHGLGGKTLIAVIDQRLINRRRQVVAVALLSSLESIVEMRALFRPACGLVQLIVAVCPGRGGAEHQQQNKQTTHWGLLSAGRYSPGVSVDLSSYECRRRVKSHACDTTCIRLCRISWLIDTMHAMRIPSDHPLLLRIVDDLAANGWSQQNIFLPEALTLELEQECRKRAAEGELEPAAIGKGAAQEIREGIRGDRIEWLEAGQVQCCDSYLELMESLRQALNRGLFLGLEDYESHFALYPPGARYLRHVDRFRDDDKRMVSAVLYLNNAWLPEHGGQLRMYLKDDVAYDVQPTGGCLVVFLSGDIPHEVMPASRDRLSLTGWFRRRGNELFQ